MKHFDIETEAIDATKAEQLPGNRATEAFETALGIVQTGQDQNADGKVDQASA